ncbi:histidine acid phosphatase, partial [Francisella tularensis subsp. holarctica]|nr:histidine acid phosphatase [Francisella tularensis subsp. holarctica]
RKIFTIVILNLIAITPIFAKYSYYINAPQLTNANIVFAADIFRHGARTSTQYFPKLKYPPLWNVDNFPAGQLTQYVFELER